MGAAGRRGALAVAGGIVLVLLVVSVLVGQYDLGAEGGGEMLWITRLPRTAALMLAGCAMAVSGLVMQLLTQNKFVEPTTTGASDWAGLGLLAVTLALPTASLPIKMLAASAAAFAGSVVFMAMIRRVRARDPFTVPLIGIMLGSVVGAATTYLAVKTDYLQMITTWFMGSFTPVVRGRYELEWIVAGVTVAVLILARRLTVAGLGRDMATGLGLNYRATVALGTGLVAVATGVTTVVVGFLPFLGLVVPNLVSLRLGDDLRRALPWVALGGIGLITACDILGRLVVAPFEVPVSLILAVIGAVVFLVVVLRWQRGRGR
ncbi:MAG: iron chelate uptake ABC transporter family permease subunit [Bifidobacteriaceae bacterium]|nr:iron chelate uptake ABC transporter family permease subunit [Bifidobacteriaceae bacterium]